jgi:uncharacterized protein with GYD domain
VPKSLVQASYTAEGVKGLQTDGSSKRRATAETAIKELVGKLEALYFAFGDTDAFTLAGAPDNIGAGMKR